LSSRLWFAEKVVIVRLSTDVVDFDAAHGVIDFPDQSIACIREPAAVHTRIATQFPCITWTRLPCEISDALPNFLAQFPRELLYLAFEGAVKRYSSEQYAGASPQVDISYWKAILF